jgi:hypothetical protein
LGEAHGQEGGLAPALGRGGGQLPLFLEVFKSCIIKLNAESTNREIWATTPDRLESLSYW